MAKRIASWRGVALWQSGLLAFFIALPPSATAAMDGTLGTLTRDASRLSMELGQTLPCPLPKGAFSGLEKGRPLPLASLCVTVEMSSFLHHAKIREFMRIMPPEKVFAVYWEGKIPGTPFLGPALPAYRALIESGRRWRKVSSGPYLFLSRPQGTLVIDRTLLPPGLDPETLAP